MSSYFLFLYKHDPSFIYVAFKVFARDPTRKSLQISSLQLFTRVGAVTEGHVSELC